MYILFDVGGTKMRVAKSADHKTFSDPVIIDTPDDFDEGVAVFRKISDDLRSGEKVDAAGGGVAGPLDKAKTMLLNAPHLSRWIKKPLKAEFEKAIGAPVFIENDAAIVGLGEAHAGAGIGHHIVAYITVGTGIGGARIVGGCIDANAQGFEPGHQIIDMDGTVCPSCVSGGLSGLGAGKGHLEGYVSGTATEERFGKKPHEITDGKIWDELALWLAYGLHNTIVHWSPDAVVVGGSMVVKKPGISVERVRSHLKRVLTIFPECPEVKEAVLADLGGLHGALVFVNQRVYSQSHRY